ncbi:glycosyltransferase family 4 protein [Tenacibaculum finnmarkense]|uniref:glycosyltransferase family 4 protein n=1 Tax=Tenacibaculum finnmarkense TaxID=2781243 RepID=UPI001EFB0C30|nr:glycosyltransferase family 4 protein [Tenacibaculum finnmarkense]MCG8236933.1 glycosyltransferase family 4 protein [Tenacibaculum finnmarkense genomovar ulcerans]MCG8749733.1 glycosyltransferase family 4 protein [Tenacibaculum finnmarkense]MCG8754850.1 glycosyltransferase family 4 protein [Tenacibaculum finnmarkense]MCG8783766.1 glycosyltransferase family 4 protein [Tenacibaculum finnmarkense]MCG8831035.1 glycosyltransferase family 4 protein [Tenacibaculum finnmarkense]
MRKILFTISNIEARGGTERTTYIVASGLAERGYDVYLFSTKGKVEDIAYEYSDKINFVIQKTNANKLFSFIRYIYYLSRFLVNNKITTLVSVEVMSVLFTFPALLLTFRRKKTQYVVWEHFNASVTLDKKIRVWCRELASKYANTVVTLTQRDVVLWKNKFKVKSDIVSIPNASPFKVSDKAYACDSKKIISIGRLTDQKGFDKLITIVSKLKQQEDITGWKFQIIGSGEDKEALEKQIKDLDVEDVVEMVPNTPKIKEYYQNASFLAMTSRFEGLPMTLLEAQSYGLPLIAYDCLTGPSEVINDGNNGFLIPDNNEDYFINKLKELMNNQVLRKKMSIQAKLDVANFSEEKIINKWIDLIN